MMHTGRIPLYELLLAFSTIFQWSLLTVLYSVVAPLFETHCLYVEAKLAHFLSWTQDEAGADVGPFFKYPKSEYWAYADYKYIALLFQDLPSMFEVIILILCGQNIELKYSKETITLDLVLWGSLLVNCHLKHIAGCTKQLFYDQILHSKKRKYPRYGPGFLHGGIAIMKKRCRNSWSWMVNISLPEQIKH